MSHTLDTIRKSTQRKHKKPKHHQVLNSAPEIKKEEIEEIELVGSGQYGDVLKGRCRGLDVAIKILHNKFGTEERLLNWKREVEIMSRIRFPNVCLLLGACTDPSYFCIVQEFLSGGDLGNLLENGKLPKSFYARMRLGCQVARGMLWIHSTGVLHRDLKLENLILDRHGEVKVCDFGLADMTEGMKFIFDDTGTKKGSPLYMAPEVLKSRALNTKLDVYSFGIILWELLAQKRAFKHHLKHNDLVLFTSAICDKQERPPIPPPDCNDPGWSNEYVVKLLRKSWSDKPKDRPDFQEIYEELNVLVVDGYIKDDWGRNWWLINFPDEDVVSWDHFYKTLICKKVVELEDGSTFCRGLAINKDQDTEKDKQCLKLLLAQISGIKIKQAPFESVTCENFGKLLSWFGPGIQLGPNNEVTTFLKRMREICSKPWFHGNIDNADALINGKTKDHFLVRLSTQAGCFTIQTPEIRVRILYSPGLGYAEEMGSKQWFPQLADLVSSRLGDKIGYGNSEFSTIYGNVQENPLPYAPLDLKDQLSAYENIVKMPYHPGSVQN